MHCWARYLFYAVVAVLGAGQMMAACGQKGPLYLPEPEQSDARPAARAEPAPAPDASEIPAPGGDLAEPFDDITAPP
jgi:predicted small lipoprotein YifL